MLRREFALKADAIRKVTLSVDEGHLRVCNIEKPQTGLEVKFSLRATNALALLGENTANDATYSDANARRGEIVELCRKIDVATWKKPSHTLSEVAVQLNDLQSRLAADVLDLLDWVIDEQADRFNAGGEPRDDLSRSWQRHGAGAPRVEIQADCVRPARGDCDGRFDIPDSADLDPHDRPAGILASSSPTVVSSLSCVARTRRVLIQMS